MINRITLALAIKKRIKGLRFWLVTSGPVSFMSPASLYRSTRSFAAGPTPSRQERLALPPEIAFLEQAGVSPGILATAARRACAQGVGAEEVLIAESLIDEDFYDRAAALASGFDYRAALRASVARADPAHEAFDWLLAPRGAQIVDLLKLSD